jgi:hypothetical protein
MKRNLSNHNAQDSWRHTYFVKRGCVRRTYLTKDILKQKDALQLISNDFVKGLKLRMQMSAEYFFYQ